MAVPDISELKLLHNTVCKAVAEPRRIQVLYALYDQPRHVTALAECLELPQPTVSRHLAVLRNSALVTSERNGTAVVYRLADTRLIEILDMMRDILRDALERQANVLD